MEDRFLTINQLAEFLGYSVKTLRWKKSHHPEDLPPHITLHNGTYDKWKWDKEEVIRWLNERSR